MDDVKETITKMLQELLPLGDDPRPEHDLLYDLGADSLDHVEIIMDIEKKFGIEIPDEAAGKLETVQHLINYVEQYKQYKRNR